MESINCIASEYVESLEEVIEGYKYGFGSPREFIAKYYFDFIFLTLDGNTPDEPPVSGGNCGFTIDKKDKSIDVLSYGELGLLEKNENEILEVCNRLENFKENSGSLSWLKDRYKFSSSELLKIKKALLEINFQKEHIIDLLDEFVSKNRY